MTHLAPLLLATLLNALWQLPLLLAATLLCARLLHPFGPRAQHRLWSGSLVVQCILPVLSTLAPPLPGLRFLPAAQHPGTGRIAILLGPIAVLHPSTLPNLLQTALLTAWALATLAVITRFLLGLRALARLRRSASPVSLPPAAARAWHHACTTLRPRPMPTLATSPLVHGPLTLGLRSPLVLLPPHLVHTLAEGELLTLFAHECAHIRRHDFATNLALQLLALPFAIHPALAITRARLHEAREWACDAEAARALAGPRPFATSLLRLATLLVADAPRPAFTVGLFTRNTLERRIMHLAQTPSPCSRPARLARLLACASLALGTATTALALHTPAAIHTATAGAPRTPPPLVVPGGVMAGEVLTRVSPVYPPEAKAAKVQGTVRLQATISETGAIQHLRVLSGPPALRPSALDAVRQWTYKPYTFHGDPVPVQTVITITYSLAP